MLKQTEGSQAVAEAVALCRPEVICAYPITPQTEVLEYMSRRMPELGRAFVQAESEVAAINMVYGAACAGFRTMTSTSSPGMSCKACCMAPMTANSAVGAWMNIPIRGLR